MPAKIQHNHDFQHAIELVGKRWSGAAIWALMSGPRRYNELLAGIPGISDRVLTERLRELELEGVVERIVDPGPPVRVTYRLTEAGKRLRPAFEEMVNWAQQRKDARYSTAAG